MKKALILCYLFCMTALLFASCSPEETLPAIVESTTAETEPATIKDSLPDSLNFDGYEFIVSSPAVWNSGTTYNKYLVPDSITGDIINDTAYNIVKSVEDRLNVTISYAPGEDMNVSGKILKSTLAGDKFCDAAIIEPQYWDNLSSLLLKKSLYNLKEMPYLTLDAPYYFPYINDWFTVNNRLYTVTSYYGNASIIPDHMVFNASMMADLNIEKPYTLIKNGGWTFDAFESMLKNTYADLNGDGEKDVHDRYGYVNEDLLTYNMFWGFGINVIERDSDGTFIPDILNDRLVSAYQKILNFHETNAEILDVSDFNKLRQQINNANPFTLGNTLFATTGTGNLYAELREVKFDIGIAPYPKYDENQKNYQSIASVFPICVPVTVTDKEAVGAVIEALSSASKQEMEPAMIDVYIEQKVLRDQDSIDVYDLLKNTVTIDITMYYQFNTGKNSLSPITFLSNCTSETVVSKLTAIEKVTAVNIEKYFKTFYTD